MTTAEQLSAYSDNLQCRKCGHEYLSMGVNAIHCPGGYRSWWLRIFCKCKVVGEHTHRHCLVCGGHWLERCYDATEPPSGVQVEFITLPASEKIVLFDNEGGFREIEDDE